MSSSAPRHPYSSTRQANVVHPDPPSKGYQPKTRNDPYNSQRLASASSTSRGTSPSSYYNLYRRPSKSSWPPSPTVEDELTSLARESLLNPRRPAIDDVPHRGSIDQEPILIEVENIERRFTFVGGKTEASRNNPAGLDTDVRRNRPPRKRPSPIDLAAPEEFPPLRRQPSPYAFVKTPEKRPFEGRTETRQHLTPPRSRQSSPTARYNRHHSEVDGYNSISSMNTDDSDGEPLKSALRRRGSHKNAHVHFGRSSSAAPMPLRVPRSTPASPRASISDLSGEESTARAASERHYREAQRASTFPVTEKPRSSSRGTHTKQSDNLRKDSIHDFQSHGSYRETSHPTSSPRSSHQDSPGSTSKDSPCSRRSSPTSSPASSPRSPHFDVHHAKEKPARPTPLSTSTRQESADKMPQVHSPRPLHRSRSNLPYPVEDSGLKMPHESHYRAPATATNARSASVDPKRAAAASAKAATISDTSSGSYSRPSFAPHHSAYETPTKRPVETARSSSADVAKNSPRSSAEISTADAARSKDNRAALKGYPPCPRQAPSRKYDGDWYTVVGDETIDICPTCVKTIVQPSGFRQWFVQAPPHPSSRARSCQLGTSWMRIAWTLTMQRKVKDMRYIYKVAGINTSEEPCPLEEDLSTGPSYGLEDSPGVMIQGFAVCRRDRKMIEALFPSFNGHFRRLSSSKVQGSCKLRELSTGFPALVDILTSIDHTARSSNRAPDLKPLKEHLKPRPSSQITKTTNITSTTSNKIVCPRDTIQPDTKWHYIPSHPSTTICASCYGAHILPLINRPEHSSTLAYSFNRTPQHLPSTYTPELGLPHDSSTCQLYSPRMHRVLARAVKYDDIEYFVRKVTERRKVEAECRRRQKELARLLEKGSGVVRGREVRIDGKGDTQEILRELRQIQGEWNEWE